MRDERDETDNPDLEGFIESLDCLLCFIFFDNDAIVEIAFIDSVLISNNCDGLALALALA